MQPWWSQSPWPISIRSEPQILFHTLTCTCEYLQMFCCYFWGWFWWIRIYIYRYSFFHLLSGSWLICPPFFVCLALFLYSVILLPFSHDSCEAYIRRISKGIHWFFIAYCFCKWKKSVKQSSEFEQGSCRNSILYFHVLFVQSWPMVNLCILKHHSFLLCNHKKIDFLMFADCLDWLRIFMFIFGNAWKT